MRVMNDFVENILNWVEFIGEKYIKKIEKNSVAIWRLDTVNELIPLVFQINRFTWLPFSFLQISCLQKQVIIMPAT